ncbi:ATP-binding protein [Frankia sp. CNm7]|uniref:ATP-binding protein n=1 Tax=Frankia nepalensis TaxID=1836974 RepID=A0A937RFU2_9ACTN|nr:ATP-binding protein [Frankia nepalensis]MBL7495185.1 ATP-binding protein [Frankia nepalensis]MBL7516405.1 ATP-binding protein [Frankia nepalensis]MBL7519792.1 ATP-binding protein [Frankia nepalensis]MBL7629262.1 ATP-binding protein [Frankia nepalensis]
MTTTPETETPQGRLVGRFTLPAAPHSPRQARRRLTPLLHHVGIEEHVVDVAVLLASELVTNAVLHGRGDPTVEIRASDRQVWVGVQDPDSRIPRAQHADSGALGGRGLHLVDTLAHSWGTAPIAGDGKTVWFTLPRQSA